MIPSGKLRLLAGILSAGLFCHNPLRLQQTDEPSGRQSNNTDSDSVTGWSLMADWGLSVKHT